jgi:hypothetical protein
LKEERQENASDSMGADSEFILKKSMVPIRNLENTWDKEQ